MMLSKLDDFGVTLLDPICRWELKMCCSCEKCGCLEIGQVTLSQLTLSLDPDLFFSFFFFHHPSLLLLDIPTFITATDKTYTVPPHIDHPLTTLALFPSSARNYTSNCTSASRLILRDAFRTLLPTQHESAQESQQRPDSSSDSGDPIYTPKCQMLQAQAQPNSASL